MKTYKIHYIESGTCYNTCIAWVDAESEEEAIKKLKGCEIVDTEVLYTSWDDDYHINDIEKVEVLNDN